MNRTKKVLIIILSLVAVLSIYLTYKAYMNKPVILDNVILKDNSDSSLAIYVEKSSYSSELDKYEVYNNSTFPTEGYVLNSTKSGCVDENDRIISNALNYSNNKVILSTRKSNKCYLYFDKVASNWKYYGWNGSTTYDTFADAKNYGVALRTNGNVALYNNINSSNKIVEVCGEKNGSLVCVRANSYNNSSDLETQCDIVGGSYMTYANAKSCGTGTDRGCSLLSTNSSFCGDNINGEFIDRGRSCIITYDGNAFCGGLYEITASAEGGSGNSVANVSTSRASSDDIVIFTVTEEGDDFFQYWECDGMFEVVDGGFDETYLLISDIRSDLECIAHFEEVGNYL